MAHFFLFQENIELSQDQQALISYIVDAHNKHRIPQDMAKKLVCLLKKKNKQTFYLILDQLFKSLNPFMIL